MLAGLPRGYFYYSYSDFMDTLFDGTDVEIAAGPENSDDILERGSRLTADEACLPVRLFAGQIDAMQGHFDRILIPRIMKDAGGLWLCPKLLGIPELSGASFRESSLYITDPVYFNKPAQSSRVLCDMGRSFGLDKKKITANFRKAYRSLKDISAGRRPFHIEAGNEFMPPVPGPGEIVLPCTKKVLLAGHCYNVFDRFANGNIVRKLDDMGIGVVTEKDAVCLSAYRASCRAGFMKKPFWEAFSRIYGTVMSLMDEIDGIIYLSSFSCGIDPFITEMIRKRTGDMPFMVLKLDEHKGDAGVETRIEAFADMLGRRCG